MQPLHVTGSTWNRYQIHTNKPSVYTGRVDFMVRIGFAIWSHMEPFSSVSNRSRVNRVDCTIVDLIPNGSEHIRSRVNVTLNSFFSKVAWSQHIPPFGSIWTKIYNIWYSNILENFSPDWLDRTTMPVILLWVTQYDSSVRQVPGLSKRK